MTQKTKLSRRTILRGMGTAISLPLLEAMMPSVVRSAARGAGSAQAPVRMALLYVPNGMHMPDWTPTETGRDYQLPATLKPIGDFRDDFTMLSGLTLNGARALGDGGGDHARSVAAFLTGAHPRKTNGADINNGASVDQVAAAAVGDRTRFPSLELGCEPSAQSGKCDSGYSCVYTSNMSWRSPTQPMPKEINPRAAFDRLFGDGDERNQDENSAQRLARRKSILDFALEDASDLHRRLGTADRRKLDEYLSAVREIERRVVASERAGSGVDASSFVRPEGKPSDFDEHVRVMMDIMVLAFQTDLTRAVTFMYTNAGSNRSYRKIGVPEGHHTLSHHGGNDEKQAKIAKINRHHVSLFAHLLQRLKAIPEGDSTLLGNSMIMYGSGIADGNRHAHHDLPILVAGSGGGTIATGQHIRYPKETPLTNLFVSMLERMGVPNGKVGDCTGPLDKLDA